MGIVVDISQSKVKFTDPDPDPDTMMNIANNQVAYDMQSFATSFNLKFDPDPKTGYGGAPSQPLKLRIGIVQNLLYEMLLFEYDGGFKRKFEASHPQVDALAAAGSFPFYGEPYHGTKRKQTQPYVDIWHTAQGYGDERDAKRQDAVVTTDLPDYVDSWDEPSGGAALRKDGALISRIEKIVAFQSWLAVQNGDKFEALAFIAPFTLVFWFYTTPDKSKKPRSSLEMPPFKFGFYGVKGIQKSIDYRITGVGGDLDVIQAASGSGGRPPVTSGPLASARTVKFLQDNGLAV